MKLKKLLAMMMFVVIITVSCQVTGADKPAVTDTPLTGMYPPSDLSVGPGQVYPGSTESPANLSAYPGPTTSTVLYPDAKSGDEVSWNQALSMIQNGEVTQVMQSHDLKVYLTLQDGRTLMTVEPAIDEIIKMIKKCGENCKNIQIATE